MKPCTNAKITQIRKTRLCEIVGKTQHYLGLRCSFKTKMVNSRRKSKKKLLKRYKSSSMPVEISTLERAKNSYKTSIKKFRNSIYLRVF